MTEQTLTLAEAEQTFLSLPDRFEEGIDVITVTRSGKPVMSILPHQTYLEMREIIDSLVETLKILRDKEMIDAFQDGVQALQDVELVDWEIVKRGPGGKSR
jgi:antitoxin (DNA-binding transcriptional repressor) of toxin-antitoxin stability system